MNGQAVDKYCPLISRRKPLQLSTDSWVRRNMLVQWAGSSYPQFPHYYYYYEIHILYFLYFPDNASHPPTAPVDKERKPLL